MIVVFIISRYGDSVNKKTQKPHIGRDIFPDLKLLACHCLAAHTYTFLCQHYFFRLQYIVLIDLK